MARRKQTTTDESTKDVSSEDTSVNTENLALGDESETQPASPINEALDVTDAAVAQSADALALATEMETQTAAPVSEADVSIAAETLVIAENIITEVHLDNPVNNPVIAEPVDALLTPDDINAMTSNTLLTPDEIGSLTQNPTYSTTQTIGANSMTNNPMNGSTSSTSGINYDDYQVMPESPWPPPVFVKRSISPQERYYIEHRWHSQWRFFDKKANDSKKLYLRLQRIVVIGSVTVPVLVSLDPDIIAGLINLIPIITVASDQARLLIDFATVVLSLAVAIAAGLESLNKYGDNWGSYRQAAEELQAEKSFYDVGGGRYANNPDAFARFVERTEEIIAQQNGRFVATVEKQNQESDKRSEEVMSKDRDGVTITPDEPIMQETSFG